MRFIDDNYVFILVQHAPVEVFGQHVRVNILKLLTEPFQLHHPPLFVGQRGLHMTRLLLVLLHLLGQVDGSQPVFLSCVGAWSVFSSSGVSPATGLCCLRTTCFNPGEEGVNAGAPVGRTVRPPTDVHGDTDCVDMSLENHEHRRHALFTIQSLPGHAFQRKSVQCP